MKTFTKTIVREEPLLQISVDENPSSPRDWDNLGYFITHERDYRSPDTHPTIQKIVREKANEATDVQEHMRMVRDAVNKQTGEKVLSIYPVYRYEHGNVVYRLGTATGFDYSNCGLYIVTDRTSGGEKKKDFERIIRDELETYTKYANGEVYEFVLYNDKGDVVDQCAGLYNIEDVREYLPKGWEKEKLTDYLV